METTRSNARLSMSTAGMPSTCLGRSATTSIELGAVQEAEWT